MLEGWRPGWCAGFGAGGVVVRPGGDEFVIVVSGAPSGGRGEELAADLVADSVQRRWCSGVRAGGDALGGRGHRGGRCRPVGAAALADLPHQAKRDGRDARRVAGRRVAPGPTRLRLEGLRWVERAPC